MKTITIAERIRVSRNARPLVTERGMALIMVVVILTTLLVLGTLFLQTAHLELSAATYYKSSNEAEIMAHSGFARATAELMYDVWGANEVRPFVADRWSYFRDDTSSDRFGVRIQRDLYTPMKLGQSFGSQGTGDGAGGFFKDDGETPHAYERNGQPIDQVRSITARREKELYFQRPLRTMAPSASGQKENVTTRVLTDFDAWHIEDGYEWGEALRAGSPEGVEGFGSDDIWKFGALRWHDAFLPRATDVNDCWEYGLMANRIFKDSDGITALMDRNYGNDANIDYSNPTTQKWPSGLEFTIGTLQERSMNSFPWMYVDSHRICSDSFFKVFRSELVDESFRAMDNQGNAVMGAYHLGSKAWPAMLGTTGPAININQVNNNYDYEQFNDHGKIDPWSNPLDNDAVRPQMYHYNEAKWIYIYDEDGNPRGRYAATIHPDGGMININSFQDMQNYRKDYRSFANFNTSHFSAGENLFFMADQGMSVSGYSLNISKTGNVGSSVIHGYSENLGVNFFRVGWLNDVVHPVTKAVFTVSGFGQTTSAWSNVTADTNLYISSAATLHHVNAYKYLYGPMGSRAEVALYFRKYGYLYQEDVNNNGENPNVGFDQNGDGKVTGSDIALARLMGAYAEEDVDPGEMRDEEIINEDAQRLSSIFGPHSYSYTFDRFWDTDRIIVDYSASPAGAGSSYDIPLGQSSTSDPKQGYYDARAIGSWNMDTTDFSFTDTGTSGGHNFYNFKIANASTGLLKFSRILSNTRYQIGANAGQWAPLSPHGKQSRRNWRQASKAQAMLLAGIMNKACGFRVIGNGIGGNYSQFAPYVSYGVRVDFFNAPTLGTGNKLSDPLVEVYPNPSRAMLLADVEGSANSWGGAPFTKGFSDIRINGAGLMQITEVGRAPVLGDPRNCALGSGGGDNWYNRLPSGYNAPNYYDIDGQAEWAAAFPDISTYLSDSISVAATGFYQLQVLAHQYNFGGSFDLEKKPPIMNFIELISTTTAGNDVLYVTALAVNQENVFTRSSVPSGGLKKSGNPDGTYLWARGLFYSGHNATGVVSPNVWYVIEADLFNPWCVNTTWPSFDDGARTGAFAAWELTSKEPHEVDIWDLSTGLTKVTDTGELQILKRRLFGWRGDMVFVRAFDFGRRDPDKPDWSNPNGSRATYFRPDVPVRILCRVSTAGGDAFGRMVTYNHSWDDSCSHTMFVSWPSNTGYDNQARRDGTLNALGRSWFTAARADRRIDTANSGEFFNFLDGWWDPSSSGAGGRGKFCMGYTYGYHHQTSSYAGIGSTNEQQCTGGLTSKVYWQYIAAIPQQHLTVWFHPYFFPMIVVYGGANYGQGSMGTPTNPFDRVYDFCMLPNYLRSAELLTNPNGHFKTHASSGAIWWDYGTGTGTGDYDGFYATTDFWMSPPTYKADGGPGCTWNWAQMTPIDYNALNIGADLTNSSLDPDISGANGMCGFVVAKTPTMRTNTALASGDGLSATGSYGRKDAEKYIQFLQKPDKGPMRSSPTAGSGGHFFTCSALNVLDNDDPGNWVYAWTGDDNSFSWRHRNLVRPGVLPLTNEVQYDVIFTNGTATGAKDDRLILSKSVFVSGKNIGKKISSHIYPTPGGRNCVWMTDALFWSTSDQGNPDTGADAHEWPWYEHNDGGPVQKEYTGMYDWNGNNRWGSWYSVILGFNQQWCQLPNRSAENPSLSTWQQHFFASRKQEFHSIPIGYLDLTEIDPHMTCYNDLAIACGTNEIYEVGYNTLNRHARNVNFWNEAITLTRKNDANFIIHSQRDYADNDADGVADIATDRPFSVDVNGNNLFGWWTNGGDAENWLDVMKTDINHTNVLAGMTADANGYYCSDRKVAKKFFVNLTFYPFVTGYLHSNPLFQAANVVTGKKPLLGFHDEAQFMFYWGGSWGQHQTPFNLRVNDKNRFWNYSYMYYSFMTGAYYDFYHAGLMTEFGASPVYTVLVTGQTISPDGKPHAQSKIEATVERTWDGKMNVLEYRLVPGMMDD